MSHDQNMPEENARPVRNPTEELAQFQQSAARLARALRDDKPTSADCARTRAAMPDMAEAELRGERIVALFPEQVAHMDLCLDCALEYGQLLDALLEIDALAGQPATPPPALPRHLLAALRIRGWVTRAAGDILARLRGGAEGVDLMIATLLEQLPQLPAAPAPALAQQMALGFGGDDDETTLVLATWFATQTLAERHSEAELRELSARHKLAELARRTADEIAGQLRLPSKERRKFVDEYARQVEADPAAYIQLGDPERGGTA